MRQPEDGSCSHTLQEAGPHLPHHDGRTELHGFTVSLPELFLITGLHTCLTRFYSRTWDLCFPQAGLGLLGFCVCLLSSRVVAADWLAETFVRDQCHHGCSPGLVSLGVNVPPPPPSCLPVPTPAIVESPAPKSPHSLTASSRTPQRDGTQSIQSCLLGSKFFPKGPLRPPGHQTLVL